MVQAAGYSQHFLDTLNAMLGVHDKKDRSRCTNGVDDGDNLQARTVWRCEEDVKNNKKF